ncbi:MAG: cytochrome c oxidase subunit 3 [Terriglobales bacterium]
MSTTVHEPPKVAPVRKADKQEGGGGQRNLVPSGGSLLGVGQYSPPPASLGVWVAMAAITMSFAAFTSALIVREGASMDWRHFALPSILYFNTVVLFASSVTLEIGKRRVNIFMGGLQSRIKAPATWLYVTLFLGIVFVAGQYVAWLQLKSQGFYLATNPSSSFFYVLTAAHALHVLGGLGGLARVIRKLGKSVLRRSTLDATSYYWHFMDVLWLYLLLLLWSKM